MRNAKWGSPRGCDSTSKMWLICKHIQLPKSISRGDDITARPHIADMYVLVAPGSGTWKRVYETLCQGTKKHSHPIGLFNLLGAIRLK